MLAFRIYVKWQTNHRMMGAIVFFSCDVCAFTYIYVPKTVLMCKPYISTNFLNELTGTLTTSLANLPQCLEKHVHKTLLFKVASVPLRCL